MPADDQFVYAPPCTPLQIMYEDQHLVVIDKPAGLLSVPGRLAQHQDSAYVRVQACYAQARVIHRLDMATSGLLIFAKHREAEVAMSKLFQSRDIYKQYIALVQGQAPEAGCINAPLIADWPNRPKQKVDFSEGKAAQTQFRRVAYCAQSDSSRLELQPLTGRSHQLRVHTAHIGHPILGDNYYHPEPKACGLGRMALHAAVLQFVHPISAQHIELHSPAPF